MITPEQMQEWKALCHWKESPAAFILSKSYNLDKDREYTTTSRTALPLLIAEVERLQAEVAVYAQALAIKCGQDNMDRNYITDNELFNPNAYLAKARKALAKEGK